MKKIFLTFALGCMVAHGAQAAGETVYSVIDRDANTLTYYYDDKMDSRKGANTLVEEYNPGAVRFAENDANLAVTKGIIDPSMYDAELTTMKKLFYGGNKSYLVYPLMNMTTIEGLEFLNTSKVTVMDSMFINCAAITSLDLTSFDMTNVEKARYMFEGCDALTTIYCNDDWNKTSKLTNDLGSAYRVFWGCTNLRGGLGTEYDGSNVYDKKYACPDVPGQEGYFTPLKKYVYSVTDGQTGVLTYYYDEKMESRGGTDIWVEKYDPNKTRFADYNYLVKKAVIAPSLKVAKLTSIRKLFYGEEKDGNSYPLYWMTTIEGLENLNTSLVTNMDSVFLDCNALTSLDLNSFKMEKVNTAARMFYDCRHLQTIYCDNDWSKYSIISNGMFDYCYVLEGGNGTKFNEENHTIAYALPDGKDGKPGYFTSTAQIPMTDAKNVLRADTSEMMKLINYAQAEVYTLSTQMDPMLDAYYHAKTRLEGSYSLADTQYEHTTITNAFKVEAPKVVAELVRLTIESYETLRKTGDSEAVKKIINDAEAPIKALVWNFAMTADENIAHLMEVTAESLFIDTKTAAQTQRATEISTGIEEGVEGDDSRKLKVESQKLWRNGMLLIIRDGVLYNAQGQLIIDN